MTAALLEVLFGEDSVLPTPPTPPAPQDETPTAGSMRVGGVLLHERRVAADQVNASSGVRTLSISGAVHTPGMTGLSLEILRGLREDLMGIRALVVPIIFSYKTDLTGFYWIRDLGSGIVYFPEQDAMGVTWNLTADLVGPANTVDIESRLTGVARANDFSVTGERWHAPAAQHTAYWTGSTMPSGSVSRTSAYGYDITVYRGLPANVDPRWSTSCSSFLSGRTRLVVNDIERSGARITLPVNSPWLMDNGLVFIRPSDDETTTFDIACWSGGDWDITGWNLTLAGNLILPEELYEVTVLRNENEIVTIRLLISDATAGRVFVDLSLRRGSRFVEAYVQASSSVTMSVKPGTTTASAQVSGYVTANAANANGDKIWVGSARSFTVDTVNGGFSKAATTTMDFAVGAVVDGDTALDGDLAADLYDQYIGALPETTEVVAR